MEDKSKQELYQLLRTGTEEEAAAAEEELSRRDENFRKTALRAAVPAIVSRNFSHGIGKIGKNGKKN